MVMQDESLWYKDGIIYQTHVRAFFDSNGDGIGDFQGLTRKLDYLQDLGINILWLLPFYPSPLRDDGYDIADYTAVNPSYGTLADFKAFLKEAHRRGIRVVTELVINHTSDQHPWFQKSRRARPGSPWRDFYVWSDTPEKYTDARIIFKDFETSNWAWDPVANAYYWHRFFSHQPDLNFENPAVHEALMKALDFWMDMGVDAFRLDAIPYLFEREGTTCENLPETHQYLKRIRAHMDEKYPGRMLLAEANQWPEDSLPYFGDGDECHMAFHFPVMPRMYMSWAMEDRFPIIDIMSQTPPIPDNCQWAMFLRNHDELTLEMVTDEDRDYMWRTYAKDKEARINPGIRRRLAPLLDNHRGRIHLMNGLLFSMPGTPIVYYGDEIGMGDNIFLGDRNGVRTPMQWSGDRNAGFSRANPQRLFLPVIIDPEYHYETINVEAQMTNPSSLLWWMRRLIALRKHHPVFGRGDIRFLTPANAKVLAFLRTDEQEHVLVVANLSRFAQPVELDLSEFTGATPIEMYGNVRFPPVPERGGYTLSVGPHGFYWFLLEPAAAAAAEAPGTPDVQVATGDEALLDDPAFDRALTARLPRLLPTRRWFVSKARSIRNARVADRITFGPREGSETQRAVFLVDIEFTEGEPDLYALPLTATPADEWHGSPAAEAGVFMRVGDASGRRWVVQDGMTDPEFARLLLRCALDERTVAGRSLRLAGRRIAHDQSVASVDELTPKIPEHEQGNSSVVFGEPLILKLYRRLGEGTNTELAVGEHLTARASLPNT